MKQRLLIFKDSELDKAGEEVKKALADGCFRIGLIIIKSKKTVGEIIGELREVIKGNIYPSLSVWIVKSEEEAQKLMNMELGELYA
ncbi:MAG: hypothetical protein GXO26_07850 [Crenarchaeota archaeon]|nr:hypothetical protein [Thermoproteota archaeon]